jgi:hypothetical protein
MEKPALLFTSEATGEQWALPKEVVAHNRALYYSKKDPDTTYKEEFDYVMRDDYEAIDWFRNNMDPEDVLDQFILVQEAKGKSLARKIREYEVGMGKALFFLKDYAEKS